MIKEVINEILQAEKQAEEIKESAENTAFQISADAQKQQDAILADAVKKAKEERDRILAESKQMAENNYKNILQQSDATAKKIASEKGADVNALGEQIFGRIINGNC